MEAPAAPTLRAPRREAGELYLSLLQCAAFSGGPPSSAGSRLFPAWQIPGEGNGKRSILALTASGEQLKIYMQICALHLITVKTKAK